MEVTTWTGTARIRPERRSPAVLLKTNSGETMVVDCGWGVPDALRELQRKRKFALNRLGHLAITHRHADHFQVTTLLHSQFVSNRQNIAGETRSDKLVIHGYPGITRDLRILTDMMIPEPDFELPPIIEHGDGRRHTLGSFTISAALVPHSPYMPSLAYCVEADGKKAVMTGDMSYDESLIPFLRNADIAVMDAADTESMTGLTERFHMAPSEAGRLAELAGVKHAVLTSLTDRESPDTVFRAARANYAGKLTVPKDGQVFRV